MGACTTLSHIHSREARVCKEAVSHLLGSRRHQTPPFCKQQARREVTNSHTSQGLAVCSGILPGVLTTGSGHCAGRAAPAQMAGSAGFLLGLGWNRTRADAGCRAGWRVP